MTTDPSPPTDTFRTAIIGAGLAGLSCARALQAAGRSVTVFEKSRGTAGRMSTRRLDAWHFDHGADGFSATSPPFVAQVDAWVAEGVLARWQPRSATWQPESGFQASRQKARFVAQPGMSALGRHVAKGLSVRRQQRVLSLANQPRTWFLDLESGGREGPFHHVVIATPQEQAIPLLDGTDFPLAPLQAQPPSLPCWILMFGWNEPLALPWDRIDFVDHPHLARALRNNSKPGRPGAESWVLQLTPEASRIHLEATGDSILAMLQTELCRLLGATEPPVITSNHRWRFAQQAAVHPRKPGFAWDASLGIGVCGAYLEGGGVEAAWRSGKNLAASMITPLSENKTSDLTER